MATTLKQFSTALVNLFKTGPLAAAFPQGLFFKEADDDMAVIVNGQERPYCVYDLLGLSDSPNTSGSVPSEGILQFNVYTATDTKAYDLIELLYEQLAVGDPPIDGLLAAIRGNRDVDQEEGEETWYGVIDFEITLDLV